MERHGEETERGDMNRDASRRNELTAERQALDEAFET
jgi:hypothetical protein